MTRGVASQLIRGYHQTVTPVAASQALQVATAHTPFWIITKTIVQLPTQMVNGLALGTVLLTLMSAAASPVAALMGSSLTGIENPGPE